MKFNEKVNLLLKSKKPVLATAEFKGGDGTTIFIDTRESKNNYTEYTVRIIEKDKSTYETVVYNRNEAMIILNKHKVKDSKELLTM